ncbi:MAG: hypothetical protein WC789_09375 [Lentisphaeria bacterium]
MSGFTEHCERELRLAGLFDAGADYGGMIGTAVMRLAWTHDAEGHSGMSSSIVRAVFHRLLAYEALTPITSRRQDWMLVSRGMWQSRRCPHLFSTNGGRTYYSVNDPKRKRVRAAKPRKAARKPARRPVPGVGPSDPAPVVGKAVRP